MVGAHPMTPILPMIETASTRAARRGTATAIIDRIRAHARLQSAWMERLWSEGQTSADQGLSITPGEVNRVLTDPSTVAERYELFLAEPAPRELLVATEETDKALASDPFWQNLAQTFDLTAYELDLLTLLVAVELDPALARVIAYLADDTRATAPTLLITSTLFKWNPEAQSAMTNILRWRLAHPLGGEPAWRGQSPWQVDEALVRSIQEESWTDPTLNQWLKMVEPAAVESLPLLYPELLTELLTYMRRGVKTQHPVEVALTGPEGCGRQTLASQLAASLGRPLLAVDTSALTAGSPTIIDDLIRAVRAARAHQAIIYWRDPIHISPGDWTDLRALAHITLIGSRSASPTATYAVSILPLPTIKRLELWSHLSSNPAPTILRTQRLTPAEIVLATNSPDQASMRAALTRSVPRSSELLNILPCPYTWDDLVVSPELQRSLHDLESQVRLRWEVYEEWGFSRLTPIGQGISALFGGPSGTGKTMAAQVLAHSLDLTLYRVDLAGVVNKYIGETEKRLRDVFDSCERSGGLLFFDEADALFGSRMQVRDAHDRFANIEIDYLLQRIEQFDGVAILATNRKNDLDTAFLRRLRFVVDFLPPGKPERLALWQKALLTQSPSGEPILGEIDFQGLADNLDLNGAQIKAIALGAAFLARSESAKIAMEHLELAAAREFAKQGLRLRQPFGKQANL
jgi:SpoVK/Ycf46/Vps4 family AAA+-type ATPase